MSIFRTKSTDSRTRERLFTEKYDWLFSRAMRLVHGDRTTAEDLVQDTFVRFVLAETELRSTKDEDIEPLLYTFLKFAHLTHLRRLQRYPSEPLSLAKYDFLELALRANASAADRVDAQNTLRRIAAYACWRKESAKSASVLILRYFHGYYPEEIARIAQTSRQSIGNQLQESREEVSEYISSSGRLRIIRQPEPSKLAVPYSTTPSDQLVPELRKTIFASCQTKCLSEETLRKRYQKKTPIPRELLAHIVSCERCLNLVSKFCGITQPTDRYLDETLGPDKQSRARKKKESSDLKRAMQLTRERFRESYEHEPQQLNIVVNGTLLATQDVITFALNRLEVKLGPEVKPEFIEVISEQGVCLLAMYVDDGAGKVQEEIHHEIDLSYGREIRAQVRFTTVGALVQVAYYAPEEEAEVESETDEMEDANAESTEDIDAEPTTRTPWWTRLWRKVPWLALPQINPVLAGAVVLAAVFVTVIAFWPYGASKPNADDILSRAVAANAEGATASPGVIYQKVRIRTKQRTLERSIYRDRQGRRKPKAQKLSSEDAQLQTRLASANVPWDDPLSAATYGDWRDQQSAIKDEVADNHGLLTLTSTSSSGLISSESLTLREQDLHPVERTIAFRDSDTIDIAEVDYSVLPWIPASESLFEPVGGSAVLSPQQPRVLVPLTQTELDEAELRARLALNQLHADTDLYVEVERTGAGIRVRDIVESEQRKRDIEVRLKRLPNVIAAISTFREMERSPARQAPSTLKLYENTSAPSPLQQYLMAEGWTPGRAVAFSAQLLDASIAVGSESKALDDLSRRFGPPNQLADSAANLFDELIGNHTAALMAALEREDSLLAEADVSGASIEAASSSSVLSLADSGQRNNALCEQFALAEAGTGENPSPELVLPELRQSIVQTRAAASRMSAALANMHRFNAAR